MKYCHSLFALAAAAALAAPAQAIVVTGTTAGGPTWTRPLEGTPPTGLSGVGVGVRYTVLPFNVSTAGSYAFLSTATNPVNWDNFLFLYQNAFSPAAALANVLIGYDDAPTIGLTGFSFTLTAGTAYFLVTTGFQPTDFGAYSNSITGPGTVNVVPEPGTYGLMALGLFGVVLAARRLSRG